MLTATLAGNQIGQVITDAAVTATSTIILTYEDPNSPGTSRTVWVYARNAGTSFTVRYSGNTAVGSYLNYYILP